MPKAKEPKVQLMVVFMEQNKQQSVKRVNVDVLPHYELQDLIDFLREQNKMPFSSCIFTTKPAEKGQFTVHKTIRELLPQCARLENVPVLLCYGTQSRGSSIEDEHSQARGSNADNQTQKSERRLSTEHELKKKSKDKDKEDNCEVY